MADVEKNELLFYAVFIFTCNCASPWPTLSIVSYRNVVFASVSFWRCSLARRPIRIFVIQPSGYNVNKVELSKVLVLQHLFIMSD